LRKRQKKGRAVNGILLLDKGKGLTSNGALQEVKRIFEAAKVGHTGSLDPMATGILPLCFGEATKFSQFLLDANKHYLASFRLGATTDTGDADGAVIAEHPIGDLSLERIQAVLSEFRGEIEQIPSMYSALKHQGKPLYKLARQGIEVERQPRTVEILGLELLEFTGDTLLLDIYCSKGTYIRTLADDVGNRLECGAHVCELRRLGSGPYDVRDSYTAEDLKAIREQGGLEALDACLLPLATAVMDWPAVELPDTTAYYLKQGQPVQISHAPTEGWVRIFGEGDDGRGGDFIGVGEVLEDGRIAPRRLIASE